MVPAREFFFVLPVGLDAVASLDGAQREPPDDVADAALVPDAVATRDLSFAAALEVLPFSQGG